MEKIGFLGLGAMGGRMAERLLDAGYRLTVWNRTPERAALFSARGARVAATPGEAVAGASVVFAMLRDDAASQAVWMEEKRGALAAMRKGALAVECSTLSLPWTRELAATAGAQGIDFIDAPVVGSRPQAEAGALRFLVGGSSASFETVRPLLAAMGGALHRAGEQGAGCALKLMVNGLFASQLAVMAELIGFAQKAGLDANQLISIIGETPVCSPAALAGANAMLAGQWAPQFPIDLVHKDFGLLCCSAEAVAARVPSAEAMRAIYAAAIAEGFSDDNITAIARRYMDDGAETG